MTYYLNKRTEELYSKLKEKPKDELMKLREELDEQLYERKFYLTGFKQPIPVQLNCVYLNKNQTKELLSKSKIIIECISKIVDEYFNSKELQEIIKIDPFEKELLLNSIMPKGFGMMRLDAFWTGKKFQFVELNSDYPEGVAMFQNSCEVYNKILFNQETETNNKELFYENLMALYRMNNGQRKNPTIAIVGPKNRLFTNEYKLLESFFKKKGHKSFLVEPDEITKDKNGFLYFKDIKIDIIRRAGEIRYFKNEKDSRKIFESYKDGKIILINDFHNRLWGIKSIFAVLHDSNFYYLFNKKEIDTIKETIPHSYIISQDNSKNIKQEKFWTQKNDYILKPSDVSEGEDIIFAENLTQKKWREILLSKKYNGWIVQKTIPLKKRKVIQIENNRKTTKRLYTDFMVHVFMNKHGEIVFGNIGNRTSESKIVNVAKGGGLNIVKTSK